MKKNEGVIMLHFYKNNFRAPFLFETTLYLIETNTKQIITIVSCVI